MKSVKINIKNYKENKVKTELLSEFKTLAPFFFTQKVEHLNFTIHLMADDFDLNKIELQDNNCVLISPHLSQNNFKHQLGFQRHRSEVLLWNSVNLNYSLNRLKKNQSIFDACIKDTNHIYIDYLILKKSEHQIDSGYPSGITSEEFAQLFNQAGKNGLKNIYLFNYKISKYNSKINYQILAESIWYYLEGLLSNSSSIKNMDFDKMIKSILIFDQFELHCFTSKDGKTYLQAPNAKKDYHLIDNQEFLDLKNNNIPNRLDHLFF